MNLNENISRVRQLMGLLIEQDEWTRRAASGPQKCGKDAKWCVDDQGGGRSERVRREKLPSAKQQKKYNESQYWEAQLLRNINATPEISERLNTIKSLVESLPGDFSIDDKVKIIFNLTNKLTKDTVWWFSNHVKKTLQIQSSNQLTDKDVIEFIKSKGGFDEFKKYYLESVF